MLGLHGNIPKGICCPGKEDKGGACYAISMNGGYQDDTDGDQVLGRLPTGWDGVLLRSWTEPLLAVAAATCCNLPALTQHRRIVSLAHSMPKPTSPHHSHVPTPQPRPPTTAVWFKQRCCSCHALPCLRCCHGRISHMHPAPDAPCPLQEVLYTGTGRSGNQLFKGDNAALLESCRKGVPVRFFRGFKENGRNRYSYEGLFHVVRAYKALSEKEGRWVCQFQMVAIPGHSKAAACIVRFGALKSAWTRQLQRRQELVGMEEVCLGRKERRAEVRRRNNQQKLEQLERQRWRLIRDRQKVPPVAPLVLLAVRCGVCPVLCRLPVGALGGRWSPEAWPVPHVWCPMVPLGHPAVFCAGAEWESRALCLLTARRGLRR